MEKLREDQEYMDELREKVSTLSDRVEELVEQEAKESNSTIRKQVAGRAQKSRKTVSARKKK